ncbi:MAG: hypothetical protein HC840_26585 [Leptolyngbyaceae cyanobacterium RM2_2_4]|nr:hypothetical protein [Leptolyngbyaceae cyanobacterium SM1_4_3]NJN89442.1 hypothetical protein [Leptolyngbyaceae cyanobacterium SL_5_14]NJO52372.1 hypothetical protein [Leptolyngbyaceae cyanobacterium RM2_2_4]NJO67297.1 hypothetical protein [Leptolyngbyaceae cyanobacterium RM1_405_57]
MESTEYNYINPEQIAAFENTIAAFIEKSLIEAPLHHVSDEKIMAMAIALDRVAQKHRDFVAQRTQGEELSTDFYPPHPDALPPQL